MRPLLLIFSLVCTLFVAACDTTKGPDPDGGPEKGYATGKVTTADGKPLKGAKIVIDNTMLYASYSLGSSDENGNYKIQLPSVGTFMASATIKKTYNGQDYELDLDQDPFEEFSIDGAVRNFTFKMTGKRPGNTGHYGGSVDINKDIMSSLYDTENIEFTLTPVGDLIDGSKGKTLKLKPGEPYSETYSKLVDIPIGRYIMTAYYNGEGGKGPLKLKKHFSDDEYTDELTIDFEPSNMWGRNIYILSYSE